MITLVAAVALIDNIPNDRDRTIPKHLFGSIRIISTILLTHIVADSRGGY